MRIVENRTHLPFILQSQLITCTCNIHSVRKDLCNVLFQIQGEDTFHRICRNAFSHHLMFSNSKPQIRKMQDATIQRRKKWRRMYVNLHKNPFCKHTRMSSFVLLLHIENKLTESNKRMKLLPFEFQPT